MPAMDSTPRITEASADERERELLRALLAENRFSWFNLPAELEARYRAYHENVASAHLRDYWAIGALAIALLGVWLLLADLVVPARQMLFLSGLAGLFGLVIVVVAAVRVEALARHFTWLVGLAATTGIFAMHIATLLVPETDPLHTIARFGVILVTVAVFSISNLSLRPALLCVAVATLAFLPVALATGASVDWRMFGAYALGSALIGATIGFSQEIRERTVYLQGRLLFLEKRAMDRMAGELDRLSRTDALTGLPNRRHFDEFFAREWAVCAREGRPMNLLFIDVDYFKPYNDHYGHQAGDECLATVGRALGAQAMRSSDFVARYGGEEFVAVFPGTDRAGLADIGARMLAAVDELVLPHAASRVSAQVTVSIGVGWLVPGRGDTPQSLVQMADAALYRAKDAGRHRVEAAWS